MLCIEAKHDYIPSKQLIKHFNLQANNRWFNAQNVLLQA